MRRNPRASVEQGPASGGAPAEVLAALAHLPVQTAADPITAVQARHGAMAYFTKRLVQVQYATFQQSGYPIGSGSTESANKVVVEARLKGSGMHWAREHVNPLVALRTVACANCWAEVWPRISARLRSQAEQRRRARLRARHATPATPPAEHPPTPATVALTPPASANPTPAPRGKSVVNGRPTALHPWKRYDCFTGGRRSHRNPR